MTDETFEKILRKIKLPLGELLSDKSTYCLGQKDFKKIKGYIKALRNFEKMLVLTNEQCVVGGVLFYDSDDIHIFVLPEYRGKHFMSKIHKNGILKAELHPKQKISLNINDIESFDDFLMKHYLISKIGLKISNLEKIHNSFSQLESSNDFCGFSKFSEDEFIEKFS